MAYQYIPGGGMPVPYVYQPVPAGQLEQLRAAQAYQQPAQQIQQAQQMMQQPAQQGPGYNWVQGYEGAKAYLVAPGQSVLLMDSEGQSFYIKSADASGMPMPLRIFDYTERVQQPAQAQSQNVPPEEVFATREELAELSKRIPEPQPVDTFATREELAELRRQIEALNKTENGRTAARKKEDDKDGKPGV